MNIFLVLFLLCLCFVNALSLFCYWNSGCPYKFLSSKTPYNSIRGDIRDNLIHLKGCEPISVWVLVRHGKRHPGDYFSVGMKNALPIKDDVVTSYAMGKSSLCAQDVEDLKNHKPDLTFLEKPSTLTDEGYKDMWNLGKRFKEAFSKLFGNLEEGDYIFRPADTRTNTTIESGDAFVQGFQNTLKCSEPVTGFDDMVPYDKCEYFQKEIRVNNNKTYAESYKYMQHPEYLAVKDRIQRRAGLDYSLSEDIITGLYDLCRYNSSGYDNKLSPWCALFTTNDLQVLEYGADLRHYYRNGYGNPYADTFGRFPLRNLYKSFENAKSGGGKKISAFFSHSSTMDMIYVTLNLYKDETTQTSARRNPERKYRSMMSTFSSNFAAVLHRCSRNGTEEFNVVFYHNEEPLRALCEDGVCSWQEFEKKLNFELPDLKFCSME